MKDVNNIILDWYQEHKRDLPWRKSKNPYHIWVSEIMLQQTRVEAVKPYFKRFIKELPDIEALAFCEDDYLAKLWEGLGYYSRVRNMKKAAMVCVEKYNKKLPETYEELLTLPGIGPYTAAAIASIAFGEHKIAMDGNILRIFSRLLNIKDDITSKSIKAKIEAYFKEYPCAKMGDFNQACMDFANSICLPNASLRCNICPLSIYCEAYKAHCAKDLPIKKKKKDRRKEKYTVIIYVCDHKVLLHKRKETGLLANLYEFVLIEGHKAKKDFETCVYLGKYTHIFSHVEWHMKGFLIESKTCFESEGRWVDLDEMIKQYSIPSAFSYFKEKVMDIYK